MPAAPDGAAASAPLAPQAHAPAAPAEAAEAHRHRDAKHPLGVGEPLGFVEGVGLFFRRLYILQLGLYTYLSYKLLQWWFRLVRPRADTLEQNSAWERLHRRHAARLYKALVGLQGLWIKVGQYVSTRGDIFPAPYIAEFRSLQDTVPAKPVEVTMRTICSELGIEALGDVFEEFYAEPIATASIAQVHRAKLLPEHGGHRVVVKVQHHRIERRILHDLLDLRLIVGFVARLEPDLDFSPIIREWTTEVPKELDFCIEAANTMLVRDAVEQHNANGGFDLSDPLHVDCGFADPIPHLVTKRVLVMTYIDGIKILDHEALLANHVRVDDVVLNIIKAYAFQIYVLGFWNSDPHPGNFLVAQIDGRWKPVLLDFGLTKASARAVKSEVIALARILLSAKSMDFTGLLSGFRELGLKVAVDDPEKMMDAMQFVFRDTAGLEDSRKQLAERSKQNREARDRAKKEAPKGTKPRRAIEAFPGVIIFFGRVLQLLRGLCVSTDSRQSYMDVMTPFAEYFLTKSVRSPASRYGLLPSIEAEPGTLADKIRRAMKELIDQEHMLGGQVAVMRHGELVAEVSGGVQGYYDPRPVRSDTVFPVFSCGKAVAAAVLHVLVREGKASYGDSVVQHWETFVSPTMADKAARDRKGRIRISHLLGHTSGLQLAGSELLGQDPAAICDWDRMVAEMERAEPGSEPGEEMAYHIVSFGWLVGGLVEKIAKRPFGDVLADTLRRLGVGEHDGYIGIPVGIEDRLANVYWDAGELRSRILAVFAQRIASQFGGSKSGVPSLERITEHLEQNPMVAQFLEKELRQGGGGGGGMAQGSMGLLAALAAARQGAASASGAATPSDEAAGGEPAQSRDILLQRMYNSAAGAASGDDPGDASKAKEDTPSAEVRDDVSSTSSSWRRAPATRPFASMGFNSAVSSPTFFNELRVRRAVIPAANGNFSALGLARFYGRLAVEAGVSRPTAPPPGASDQADASGQAAAAAEGQPDAPVLGAETVRLMRAGDEHIDPASRFGLGFTRLDWRRAPDATTDSGGSNGGGGGRSSSSSDTNETREGLPFGHAGMGGSFAFCDPASGTAVAVTVNQLSLVAPVATRDLVNLVTAHLGLGELDAFNFEGGARDETMLAPV